MRGHIVELRQLSGGNLPRIRQILEQDTDMPKKQRHTAVRIWQILQQEGLTGGYTIVKNAVREIKNQPRGLYAPDSAPVRATHPGCHPCA